MRFELWQQIFTPRMLVAFSMGFSCGVPLLLTLSLLQAWMKEEGVSLEAIGLLALAGLPYIVKFLWAPIFDRYVPPFLGRRRGWLLLVQLLLMVVIGGIGSVTGSVVSSFLFVACSEWWLRFLDQEQMIGAWKVPLLRNGFRLVVFSVIIMAVVLFFRQGIMGTRELPDLFRKRHKLAGKGARKA